MQQNGYARLQWEVENESGNIIYEIERSEDMTNFHKIGSVNATAGGNGSASYTFDDPNLLSQQTYYRIKMTDGTASKYSKIVLLSNGKLEYAIKSLINPFKDVISFDLIAPESGTARITLVDAYGRAVRQSTESYSNGLNQMRMFNREPSKGNIFTSHIRGRKSIHQRCNKNELKSVTVALRIEWPS